MEFKLALLAVKDVEVSKKFYKELFNQQVVLDLGKNVTFSGGFAVQEDFAWLTNLSDGEVKYQSNNMELYFEVEDFDDFIEKLESYKNIQYVHPPKMHEMETTSGTYLRSRSSYNRDRRVYGSNSKTLSVARLFYRRNSTNNSASC